MLYTANNIMKMPAYEWLTTQFQEKGYTLGNTEHEYYPSDKAIMSIPENERFEYLRQHLSGCHEDYIQYVKERPDQFDKQFFKDLIAIEKYSLYFEKNIFEWMDESLIDEELIMCAMLRTIGNIFDERDICNLWFYSVQKRKPELLTYEMYVLGARCFASRIRGVDRFLDITPEEYRTEEYYYALCANNSDRVMEDIPEEVLTDSFLVSLIRDNISNIRCFTEEALERPVFLVGRIWKYAMYLDGCLAGEYIPLNDERIEFFLSVYGKDSREYRFSFKRRYKDYLRWKSQATAPSNEEIAVASNLALASILAGSATPTEAIDEASEMVRNNSTRRMRLPIEYFGDVPPAYSERYDSEEYLVEIYKKLGIEILNEADCYYYNVVFPEDVSIVKEERGWYSLKKGNDMVASFYDLGPICDRDVAVDKLMIDL